jgi:hypothetical protein
MKAWNEMTPDMAPERPSRTGLFIYAGVVLAVAVLGAVLIGSAEDASIGGAFLLGMVLLLGLPWSLVVFLLEDGLTGSLLSATVFAALAVMNAFLVQAFTGRRSR